MNWLTARAGRAAGRVAAAYVTRVPPSRNAAWSQLDQRRIWPAARTTNCSQRAGVGTATGARVKWLGWRYGNCYVQTLMNAVQTGDVFLVRLGRKLRVTGAAL